jgi:hypothetical protein
MKNGVMKTAILLLFAATWAVPASAQGFLDSLKKGADKVGEVAKKGGDAVGDAMESTGKLVRDEETPQATRAKLDTMANEVLAQLLSGNAEAARAHEISAGHAVFDMRRVSVFPLSAGYGRGVAVSPEGARTYMQMGTGGVGPHSGSADSSLNSSSCTRRRSTSSGLSKMGTMLQQMRARCRETKKRRVRSSSPMGGLFCPEQNRLAHLRKCVRHKVLAGRRSELTQGRRPGAEASHNRDHLLLYTNGHVGASGRNPLCMKCYPRHASEDAS